MGRVEREPSHVSVASDLDFEHLCKVRPSCFISVIQLFPFEVVLFAMFFSAEHNAIFGCI